MKSLTREVTTHIRTDAQGGPFNPVFGVKTPHEINEMKEEILWNKHFITIGGKSIFYKAWASRGIQINIKRPPGFSWCIISLRKLQK